MVTKSCKKRYRKSINIGPVDLIGPIPIPSIDSHIVMRQLTVLCTSSVSSNFKISKWQRTSSSFTLKISALKSSKQIVIRDPRSKTNRTKTGKNYKSTEKFENLGPIRAGRFVDPLS